MTEKKIRKKDINLIIIKDKASPILGKLKLIAPVVATVCLIIFAVSFFSTVLYLNGNVAEFNRMKRQVENLETKIASQKNIEGVYTISLARLTLISEILSSSTEFTQAIDEVLDISGDGILLTEAAFDEKGNLNFSLEIETLDELDLLVSRLLVKEDGNLFTEIQTQGVIRDEDGKYYTSIECKVDKSLLSWKN